jgi:hypothetical protein
MISSDWGNTSCLYSCYKRPENKQSYKYRKYLPGLLYFAPSFVFIARNIPLICGSERVWNLVSDIKGDT